MPIKDPLDDDDDAFSIVELKKRDDDDIEDDAFSIVIPKIRDQGKANNSLQGAVLNTELLTYNKAELLFPGLVISPSNNRNEEGISVVYDNLGNKSITSEISDSQYQEAIKDFAKKHPDTKTSALIKITDTPKCFEMDSDVQHLINKIKAHCNVLIRSNANKLLSVTSPIPFVSLPTAKEEEKKALKIQSNNLGELIDFIDDINKLKFDPGYYLKELKDKIESIEGITDTEFVTKIDEKIEKHKTQKKELYAITSQNNGWTATTILNHEQFKKIQDDNLKDSCSEQDSLLEFIANKYKKVNIKAYTTDAHKSFCDLFNDTINSIHNTGDNKYSEQAKKLKEIKNLYTQLTSDQDQAFLKSLFANKFNYFDKLMKGDYSAYKNEQEAFKQNLETSLEKIDFSNYNYKEGIIENDDISSSCCSMTNKTHGSPSISTKDYKKTHDFIYTQLPEFEEYLKKEKIDNNLSNKWASPVFYINKNKIKNSEKLIQSLKKALNSENDGDNKLKIEAIKEILKDNNFKKLSNSYLKNGNSYLKDELELLKDYYSNKKDGKTSAATLILDTRRDKENLSIGDGLFTICNKQGSKDYQLIINRDLQAEDHDNVFFKNIGKGKDGNNYYIRIFVAKGGETIYKDGEEYNPSKTAEKGEIVFDKNTVWCAKSESQLHKDEAIRISAAKTPEDIKDKFSKTNIIVLEAKDKEIIESEIFIGGSHSKITIPEDKAKDKEIIESKIVTGGSHSKMTIPPSPSTDPQSATPISPSTKSRA